MTNPYEDQPGGYRHSPSYAPTNGLAIASLILSALGLIGILPILGSILGLVLGYTARSEIERSDGAVSGAGLAQVGIILGWVGVGILGIVFCLVAAGLMTFPAIGMCVWLITG